MRVFGGPSGVVVHQLLSGREIARPETGGIMQFAAQMANYMYGTSQSSAFSLHCIPFLPCDVTPNHSASELYASVIVNASNQAVLVDACWDVDGILDYCRTLGVSSVIGAVWTHRHFDHTGGKLPPSMTGGREVPQHPSAASVRDAQSRRQSSDH
jgi:hypothetical protein